MGKIEWHIEVVIDKFLVLRGVEDFQKCCGRVALIRFGHLVDFVEQEDGVLCLDGADALDDAARHCADVRAAVPANLGFVAHAAERGMDERAPHRARNRAAKRCLANARRPDEAENRRGLFGHELAHGEVVEDAFFDVLEAIVVALEHVASRADVELFRGLFLPRQVEQPVDIRTDDIVFGRALAHGFHALELALHGFLDGFGVLPFFEALAVLGDFGRALAIFAELFANRFDFFTQIIFLLRLRHALVDARVNLLFDFEDFELAGQHGRKLFKAFADVDARKKLLSRLEAQVQMACNEVGHAARIVDEGDGDERFGRHFAALLDP